MLRVGGGGGSDKAAAPDKFLGADRTKLRDFLLSLKLVFAGNKLKYSSDRARVIYASGYLSGAAKDWFNTYAEEFDEDSDAFDLMFDDYKAFKRALE